MKAIRYVDPLGSSWDEGEIPDELKEQAEKYHHDLIEAVADHDEDIMVAFLEDEPIEESTLRGRHPRGHAGHLDHAGAAGLGVQEQGRAAAAGRGHRLPAGADRRAAGDRHRPQDGRARWSAPLRSTQPFSALAFKVMTDPFVGKLTYFRVYSGKLNSGSYVYNTSTGRKERVGRILEMHANHREDVDQIGAGAIAAAVGLKQTTTGDTLCDEARRCCSSRSTSPTR